MKLMKFFSRLGMVAALSIGLGTAAAEAYPVYGGITIGGWGYPYAAHISYGGPYRHVYYPYHSNYNYHYHYVYNYNVDGRHYHYVYNYHYHYHYRW